MCFFLTIAVPAKRADRIAEEFGRGFQSFLTANPSVTSAFPADYAARLITSGMCSCGLYSKPSKAKTADPVEQLRRKYGKRGWSEAKIDRAIEQSLTSGAKTLPAPGLRPDVVERLQSLCLTAGTVAIVVHWYNGDIETERFSLTQTLACHPDDLPTRAAQLLEDEVLIAASRSAA